MGADEKSLICDRGFELRILIGGIEKKKGEDDQLDGEKQPEEEKCFSSKWVVDLIIAQ